MYKKKSKKNNNKIKGFNHHRSTDHLKYGILLAWRNFKEASLIKFTCTLIKTELINSDKNTS